MSKLKSLLLFLFLTFPLPAHAICMEYSDAGKKLAEKGQHLKACEKFCLANRLKNDCQENSQDLAVCRKNCIELSQIGRDWFIIGKAMESRSKKNTQQELKGLKEENERLKKEIQELEDYLFIITE